MESIRFIFEIAKQVYGPNSMKIMLVDERKTANQAHGPMNINIADSLLTFLMVRHLASISLLAFGHSHSPAPLVPK